MSSSQYDELLSMRTHILRWRTDARCPFGQLRAELSRVSERLDAGLADGSAGKGGAGSQVNGRLDKAKRRAVQV